MSGHDRPAVDSSAPWTPIERQLLDSSVWEADPVVRVLWVSILIIASEPGRAGVIDMTLRSLASRACLSPEDTRRALAVLTSPDLESRSREEDGRRLVLIDHERPWGWRVVTWERRRDSRLRAWATARKQRQRSRQGTQRDKVTERHAMSRDVTQGHGVSRSVTRRRIREREGEREVIFEEFWALYPKKAGKRDAEKAWAKLTAADRAKALALAPLYADAMADRPEYVKNAQGWLNSRRFEDDPASWRAAPRNGTPAPPPALVGAHPPTPKLRELDDSAPPWALETHRRLTAREPVSDEAAAALLSWRRGATTAEPDLTPEEDRR